MNSSNFELIKNFKSDPEKYFDEVYNLSNKSIYYAAYSVLKDNDTSLDIMQETYLQILKDVNKIPNDVELTAYLVTIAKNKSINYYNRHKKELELMDNYKDYSYSKISSDNGLMDLIKETLNEREYKIFTLKVIGGYTFKEISKLLKTPIGTTTWMYQEARKKLESKLEGIN